MKCKSIFGYFMGFVAIFMIATPAYPSSYLGQNTWGIWQTNDGDSIKLVIEIRHDNPISRVEINGKSYNMEYSATKGKKVHWSLFHEFTRSGIIDGNREFIQEIYLVRGKINGNFALIGFFIDMEYDAQGVEKRVDIYPITLYRVKKYNRKD